jgi:ATP-dependent Clp protease ATP-binding subunit ClpB
MRIDRLTAKMQEALQESQTLASSLHHQELTPEHLMLALLRQPDGLVRPLLEKLGVRTQSIEERLDSELSKRPKISGGEHYLGNELRNAFEFGRRGDVTA